jgi:hypothetical protein
MLRGVLLGSADKFAVGECVSRKPLCASAPDGLRAAVGITLDAPFAFPTSNRL